MCLSVCVCVRACVRACVECWCGGDGVWGGYRRLYGQITLWALQLPHGSSRHLIYLARVNIGEILDKQQCIHHEILTYGIISAVTYIINVGGYSIMLVDLNHVRVSLTSLP